LVSIKAVNDVPLGIPKVRSLSLDFAASKIREKERRRRRRRRRRRDKGSDEGSR
jgi:hypothetical protein